MNRPDTSFVRRCKRHVVRCLAAVAALLASSAAVQAETVLRIVMNSDLKILDPIWNTAFVIRDHGYMIYDTLFATDAEGEIRPQMVDTTEVSADKLTYTFTLRDGLKWHDGQPVTAEDCVGLDQALGRARRRGPEAHDLRHRRRRPRTRAPSRSGSRSRPGSCCRRWASPIPTCRS